MLILTRRIDETIRIGTDIVVKILDIKGAQVRIGIDAPKDVTVLRDELWRKLGADGPTNSTE